MGKGEGGIFKGIKWFGEGSKAKKPDDTESLERAKALVKAKEEEAIAKAQEASRLADLEANKSKIQLKQLLAAKAASDKVEAEGHLTQMNAEVARLMSVQNNAVTRLIIAKRREIWKLTKPDEEITEAMLKDGLPTTDPSTIDHSIELNQILRDESDTFRRISQDKEVVHTGLTNEIQNLNKLRVEEMGGTPIGEDGQELDLDKGKKKK